MQRDVFQVHADVERRHWWFVARRQILRAVVEMVVKPRTGALVVDIGCGVGANNAAFAPEYDYIGYDPSTDAVEFARESYQGAQFRPGSAAEASADLERADVALLTDVIEHVPDDRALLAETLMPMRPGKWLLVTIPAGMELWSPHDVALGHYRRYDLGSFADTLLGLPVAPEFVTYFNSRLYMPVRMVRWVTARANRSAGGSGTDFNVPPAFLNGALRKVFAGEARRITHRGTAGDRAYNRGVSILALLRRTEQRGMAG